MGQTTGISWTDHTFNPWMGCQRISPACGGAKGVGGCYAEALAGANLFDRYEPKAVRAA